MSKRLSTVALTVAVFVVFCSWAAAGALETKDLEASRKLLGGSDGCDPGWDHNGDCCCQDLGMDKSSRKYRRCKGPDGYDDHEYFDDKCKEWYRDDNCGNDHQKCRVIVERRPRRRELLGRRDGLAVKLYDSGADMYYTACDDDHTDGCRDYYGRDDCKKIRMHDDHCHDYYFVEKDDGQECHVYFKKGARVVGHLDKSINKYCFYEKNKEGHECRRYRDDDCKEKFECKNDNHEWKAESEP